MVSDHYIEKWQPQPWFVPIMPGLPNAAPIPIPLSELATKQEIEEIRRDVAEMKFLIQRAIKYDKAHDEPHCEIEDKVALLRAVAKAVGVNLDDVIPPA